MQRSLINMCQLKKCNVRKKLLIAVVLFFGLACKKNNSNDCSEAACPAIYIVGPLLKFTLSDKITNKDLFFEFPSSYQLKDLIIFKKKNITDTIHMPFYIDSLNTPKHFVVLAPGNPDSLFIQIQNQKIDTIDVTSKPVIANCCLSGYIFNSINLNGKLICNDCAVSTIVDIKR